MKLDVAKTVRRLRMDLSFEEMAERLKVTPRTLYRYANRESNPDQATRERLVSLAQEYDRVVLC